MTASYTAPTNNAVLTVLSTLFPHTEVEQHQLQAVDAAYLATYRNDENELVAVCECDMEFAAKAASALSMMPPAIAEDAVLSGTLDKELYDNLSEIMDIYANLLGDESSPKPHLDSVCKQSDISEATSKFLTGKPTILFCAELPNYGSGKFAFSLA